MRRKTTSRRQFLRTVGASGLAACMPSIVDAAGPKTMQPTLLFCCDFNWALKKDGSARASMPGDWAHVDPRKYFDWHREFGVNVMFCQAYCSSGYALYPSKLGPVGKSNAATLFPRLYEMSRKAGMPVWSYFCVPTDVFTAKEHPDWIIPGSWSPGGHGGLFGPETPYTAKLCERIREFLKVYPVDWLLLDWFTYGALTPNGSPVRPAEFVEKPFKRIIGRPMPKTADEIAPEEHLKYKRTVLAEQFQALKKAVKETSPDTKLIFNSYRKAAEELWVGHPMLEESEGLFAESTDSIVNWLLKVRKPNQRVMTTVIGHGKLSDPTTWKKWHARGCDFFGYAWGTPPSFEPHPRYKKKLDITREAFQAMSSERP